MPLRASATAATTTPGGGTGQLGGTAPRAASRGRGSRRRPVAPRRVREPQAPAVQREREDLLPMAPDPQGRGLLAAPRSRDDPDREPRPSGRAAARRPPGSRRGSGRRPGRGAPSPARPAPAAASGPGARRRRPAASAPRPASRPRPAHLRDPAAGRRSWLSRSAPRWGCAGSPAPREAGHWASGTLTEQTTRAPSRRRTTGPACPRVGGRTRPRPGGAGRARRPPGRVVPVVGPDDVCTKGNLCAQICGQPGDDGGSAGGQAVHILWVRRTPQKVRRNPLCPVRESA